MSFEVKHLTKIYGHQRAVDEISFSVKRGEIVGFLGPNGAGKSTTMKIAAGYLPPTKGTILVDDLDVTEKSIEARKITGYLPEHNPLYLDMYVREYLQFIGKVYGIKGKVLSDRIEEIIELCGLGKEQHKKIEALSKGYRQRVGIAQSLIHNPTVLIMDEPTSGLDPNQILEIRKLIKDISTSKTVIFSTHILQEVEALCDRVVVINSGKIVADSLVTDLVKSSRKYGSLMVEFAQPVDEAIFKNLNGLKAFEKIDNSNYRLTPEDGVDLREAIARIAADNKLLLVGLKQEETSLEEIFRQLTIKS